MDRVNVGLLVRMWAMFLLGGAVVCASVVGLRITPLLLFLVAALLVYFTTVRDADDSAEA